MDSTLKLPINVMGPMCRFSLVVLCQRLLLATTEAEVGTAATAEQRVTARWVFGFGEGLATAGARRDMAACEVDGTVREVPVQRGAEDRTSYFGARSCDQSLAHRDQRIRMCRQQGPVVQIATGHTLVDVSGATAVAAVPEDSAVAKEVCICRTPLAKRHRRSRGWVNVRPLHQPFLLSSLSAGYTARRHMSWHTACVRHLDLAAGYTCKIILWP